MNVLCVLVFMILCHIIADYSLQGWLASAKQEDWWKKQEGYNDFYKNDYKMALFMHSFSWAFMIMLVPSVYTLITTTNINNASLAIALVFLTNLCIHMVVDNSKANLKKINLVQDQLNHLAQILITWVAFVVLGI